MGNSEDILVVFLASALAVFLVIAIVVGIKFMQLLDELKKIVQKAEKLVTSAEHVGDFFKMTARPVAVVKLLSNISDFVFKNHKKSKGEKND